MLNVTLIPVLEDNYTYIIRSGDAVAVIDPGEAAPVIRYCEDNNLRPAIIFNTHHHWDHIDGNDEIAQKYKAEIIAPEKDRYRISNMGNGLNHGDTVQFGDTSFQAIETVGHTKNHICFWFTQDKILFSGDTLFSMGCGRCFEGTAEDLFEAFKFFNTLPDDTEIYCGHEYTLSNGKFCLSIEPDNQDLKSRMAQVEKLREENHPTIPTTIGLEKKTNVFMRAKKADEFIRYRKLKDNF